MINTQFSRIQHHRLTQSGLSFTVPSSEDFTTGTWISTDLALGELGVNMTDDRIWLRTLNGLVELSTVTGPSSLWERDGSDIRAISLIDTFHTDPNILPTSSDVSSLGDPTNVWHSLYLGTSGIIVPANRLNLASTSFDAYRNYNFGTGVIETQGNLYDITNPLPYKEYHKSSVTLTGATGNIWSTTEMVIRSVMLVEVTLVGISSTSNSGFFQYGTKKLTATFRKEGGSFGQLGTTDEISAGSSSGLYPFSTTAFGVNIGAGTVYLEVGDTTEDVEWTVYVKTQLMTL